MRTGLSRPRIAGLLIVICLNIWLVTVIVGRISGDDPAGDNMEWSPNLSPTVAAANERKPIHTYEQILARPIFFKSREPFIAPPAAPPPVPKIVAPPPLVVDPGFMLAGIMIKSRTKKAFILSKSTAEGTWAVEGDSLMGWKLQSVDKTGVKPEQGGRTIEVLLYPNK